MIKKILILIVLISMMGIAPSYAQQAEENSVPEKMDNLQFIIDYEFRTFSRQPLNMEGRLLLPMREFFEAIGAEVSWDPEVRQVTAVYGEKKLVLFIDDTAALLNGIKKELDVAPIIFHDSTYIPLRFAAESLGYEIIWNGEYRTIYAFSDYEPPDATLLEMSQGAVVLPADTRIVDSFSGIASWYGGKFHGRGTSSGETYDQYAFTGAHRTLPFGTFVKVTHTLNNKAVIIRINDRGPHIKNRVLDLSMAAAEVIGLKSRGLGEVIVEVLENYY